MKKLSRILLPVFVFAALALSACAGAATPASTTGSSKVEAALVEFTGVIEAIDGNQWTVNGQVITVDPTVVKDGPFNVGDTIKVEAQVAPDGAITVTRVESPSADVNSNDDNENDDNENDDNSNDDNGNDDNSNDDNGNEDNSNDDDGDDENSNDDDANSNDDNSNSDDDDGDSDDDSGSGGGSDDDSGSGGGGGGDDDSGSGGGGGDDDGDDD